MSDKKHGSDKDWLRNPSKSEVIARLDEYRAIEIGNLWQRSVLLGTFLVLGYTGYGFLLDKMICSDCDKGLIHFFAFALACVNILFSILWIAMAKGSKAWYEVYENAISFVEDSAEPLTWKEVRCELDLRRRISEPDESCVKRKGKGFENKKNDCLFSTMAGGYSPSKINVVLGQVSMILWIIVLLIHVLMFSLNL